MYSWRSINQVSARRIRLVGAIRGRRLSRMAVRIPGINIDEYYQQLGPIEPLIRDDRVTEIMVNGNDHVYVEMAGKVVLTNIKFVDEDPLLNVIQFLVRTVGRGIEERTPLCDARLADGSRVNAVIRPLALNGPLLTIRKFSRDPYQVEDLIRFGTCNEAGFGFLKAAVLAKANIIVSGGTGTGKTTFLNVLSGFIPVEDRIVTIEDAAELQLHQEHVCRLETRPRDINGEGEVTIQRLVINALRMRPERIVVGECRGGEALDMLQAMNTGHDGSMTTIHANSPRDALARLETLVLMAGVDLPVKAIRQQVASAINIIWLHDRTDGLAPELREYAQRKLTRLARHFGKVAEAEVEFAEEAKRSGRATFVCRIHVQVDGRRTPALSAHERGVDAQAALDMALDKIDRQVVKLKEKRTLRKDRKTTHLKSSHTVI